MLLAETLAAGGFDVAPAALLDGLLRPPPSYVRANALRAPVDDVVARLRSRGLDVAPTDLDPAVLRVDRAPISPGATLEHLLGMTTPQDVSSAAAPLALGARPGHVVLDLAAAPGIKTLHLAGDLAGDGAIVAVDPDARRRRALRFNLERGGADTVVIRAGRGQDVPGEGWADRVLLDAPCTGEGTLPKDRQRRHGRPEEIQALCGVQAELARAAVRALRPGGVLVYATCALAPEENEGQVKALMDVGLSIEPLPFSACGGVALAPGITTWPGLALGDELSRCARFLPGIHPSLGFFVARLRKEAA